MQHHAKPDPVVEDAPLLALRRTLWQLAMVGVAAVVAIDQIAPDAPAAAIWCALIPFSALAVHLRYELWSLCSRPHRADAPRIRARHGRRATAGARRVSPTAMRRNGGLGVAGVR